MSLDEIKTLISFLEKQSNDWKESLGHHLVEAESARRSISRINAKIYEIRKGCEHTYLGKESGMMGRGICEICGDSDY